MRFCRLSLRHEGVLGIGRRPVSLMYNVLQSDRYAEMILAELHVKRSVILMDRLGPDIFSTLHTLNPHGINGRFSFN